MDKKRSSVILTKYLFVLTLVILCITGCGGISDGGYTATVTLAGGSGRAYIESPCKVVVEDGKAVATLVWSSPNYDFMVIDGVTYYPVNTEGNSVFEVPVQLGKEFPVQADTTAMSKPHLVDYTLLLSVENGSAAAATENDRGEGSAVVKGNQANAAAGNDKAGKGSADGKASMEPPEIAGLTYLSTDENAYAECFRIHRYSADYAVISVEDGRNYLIVPEGESITMDDGKSPNVATKDEKRDEDLITYSIGQSADKMGYQTVSAVLQKPLDTIYLAASGAMCHFDRLDAVGSIALSGFEKDDWYIDSAKKAMEEGTLLYGGKYSAPDYEQIVMTDIDLAIESTMILHVPKVQEKLEELGVPVFIDRASYEPTPLGRCEWIRVYGLLAGKENEAEQAFSQQEKEASELDLSGDSRKTVVIFSINSNHQIVTRRSGDYFAKMAEMAGGSYLSPGEDEGSNASSVTISVEAFYDYARDADILIYNASIEDAPASLEELKKLDGIFEDFKAVKEGNVWYTDKSLYQLSDKTGSIINSLYEVIRKDAEDTEFFHKLR